MRTGSLCQPERLRVQTETSNGVSCLSCFGCWVSPALKECPVYPVLIILSPSQIQEAASQGLKFVGVIPQYRCSGDLAGGSPQTEAQEVTMEPGRCGHENLGATDAPEGMDGSPEPGQGPRGAAPASQPPSPPLGEQDGVDSPSQGLSMSRTQDGPAGNLSEERGEPRSGSEYVNARALTHLRRGC